jgi:hypothetical protein
MACGRPLLLVQVHCECWSFASPVLRPIGKLCRFHRRDRSGSIPLGRSSFELRCDQLAGDREGAVFQVGAFTEPRCIEGGFTLLAALMVNVFGDGVDSAPEALTGHVGAHCGAVE